MFFKQFFSRGFIGGNTPTTEAVQRQLLTLLSGHGALSSALLPNMMTLPIPADSAQAQINQAAQILVNTGQIEATQNGRPVDPVNARGGYQLALKR